jgi:hypothetical protein
MSLGTSEYAGAAGLAQQESARIRSIQTLSQLRREARDEIARLIQFLDASDSYVMTELEDDDDLEQECEDEGAQCEDEGAISDDEPSLGSLDHDHHPNQEQWAAGGRRDLEQDDTESGIADYEGLLEQVGSHDWQGRGMV